MVLIPLVRFELPDGEVFEFLSHYISHFNCGESVFLEGRKTTRPEVLCQVLKKYPSRCKGRIKNSNVFVEGPGHLEELKN